MNKRTIIPSAVALVLGAILLFMPREAVTHELQPDDMLLELTDQSRFYSTDEVAKMLMMQDPSIILVDVRTPEEYADYHLPGAINLPLENILSPESTIYFNQPSKKIVFYSNGTIYANQAWMLGKREGFKRLFILDGGLNEWAETILSPKKPASTEPTEAFEKYNFRLSAKSYFGGGTAVAAPTDAAPMPMVTRKKKETVQGGC